MPIYKKKRFHHGADAAKVARESHKADVYEQRKGTGPDGDHGQVSGWWVKTREGDMSIKNEKVGPATNMAIVAFFSVAGIIALYVALYKPEVILRLLGIEVG